MFGALPENRRPSCSKLDESGCCPKGVPAVHSKNVEAHELFSLFIGNFLDPYSGLVKFDTSFFEVYAAVIGAGKEERQELFIKTLYLVEETNQLYREEKLAKSKKEV